MKWIKVSEELPLAGKEVLVVMAHRGNHYYALGYLCCRQGWKVEEKSALDEVTMWSELPPIEPE